MRTGIATVPLDYGKCPKWLFERMQKLARGISLAVVEEFGSEEFVKRLSDPVWFQSLGCVMGFDWNSSGLTTTTLGALKSGIFGLEKYLGVFICGGKGKTSKKTPDQIASWGESLGFSLDRINKLSYASKMAAKIDSSLVQDGFQIYHHDFIFTKNGTWAVVQQGMNTDVQKARRYHWFSPLVKEFVEEPHSGIASDFKTNPLNLTAKKSRDNRQVSLDMVKDEPRAFLKNVGLISSSQNKLMRQKRFPFFSEMELENIEFHWHPVAEEKFDLKRLEKTVLMANSLKPVGYQNLVALPGIGPRTIRALSLVAELIYGAKPSYEDPARYSFAVGGKDGTPFIVDQSVYDKTIEAVEKGIVRSGVSLREKSEAQKRLKKLDN